MPSSLSSSAGTGKTGGSHGVEPLSNSPVLTKQEAATLLKVTTRYIERQIRAGRLRACKRTGKLVCILRRDLDAFLAQGATMEAVQ